MQSKDWVPGPTGIGRSCAYDPTECSDLLGYKKHLSLKPHSPGARFVSIFLSVLNFYVLVDAPGPVPLLQTRDFSIVVTLDFGPGQLLPVPHHVWPLLSSKDAVPIRTPLLTHFLFFGLRLLEPSGGISLSLSHVGITLFAAELSGIWGTRQALRVDAAIFLGLALTFRGFVPLLLFLCHEPTYIFIFI
jgi:hypothetical protein